MTDEIFNKILLLLDEFQFKISSYSTPTEVVFHGPYGYEVYIDKEWGISILDEVNETESIYQLPEFTYDQIKRRLEQIPKERFK
ncbi:hypothetical protein M0P65_06025 [Candidatus Gracilibacteria bacterium]|nr:hypothetical protein [Candidatus Gracilibacteria bacterium]